MTQQRTMVITGASRGIGASLRNHYLGQEWRVVGCSRSEIAFEHENYQHYQCDVADEKSVRSVFFQIGQGGGLDVLINNAGVATMNHLLLTPGSSVDSVLATNLSGAIFCSREAAKSMQRQEHGRIINFSSVAVPLRIAGESVYAASKAGLESFTRTAGKELAEFGVTMNALGLTPFDTDMIAGLPAEKLEAVLQQQAISRLATIEDIVNAIDFFVKPESSFVTGQVIYLGGVS